ncbi:MAG TPA: hypothetical protein VMY06_14570 [Sedimentisphaerales bacterium]|nr:hypothetical protein [Sedimentisphaerales bacterium]HUU15555.1 hypothetical protein [Sedimentisphaerales bacterium]
MVDINVDVMLAQKNGAMEAARKSARPITEAIDERGKVSLWLISQKKWVRFWPVDAMDILRSGTANLDGPKPEPEPEPEPGESKPISVAIESMTIPELKEYAEVNKIDVSKLTKKVDIVEAIQKHENPETNKEKQE